MAGGAVAIAGKYTRAQLGMRPPRSRSLNIRPEEGGVTFHWGGPGSKISSHETCKAIWTGWQGFHMGGSRGWVDIAYTMGFCQHGWVFPGRGYGVRTAAQGSNRGNAISYAFVHINQAGVAPTPEALAVARWLVADARAHGNAGTKVWAHRDWHSTDCPGDDLTSLARSLSGTSVPVASPPTRPIVTPGDDDVPTVQEIQAGILYYPLSARYVNPLTLLQRTYEQTLANAGLLKAIQQAEASGQVIDVPALAAAIVAGLPEVVAHNLNPSELAAAVAAELSARLQS